MQRPSEITHRQNITTDPQIQLDQLYAPLEEQEGVKPSLIGKLFGREKSPPTYHCNGGMIGVRFPDDTTMQQVFSQDRYHLHPAVGTPKIVRIMETLINRLRSISPEIATVLPEDLQKMNVELYEKMNALKTETVEIQFGCLYQELTKRIHGLAVKITEFFPIKHPMQKQGEDLVKEENRRKYEECVDQQTYDMGTGEPLEERFKHLRNCIASLQDAQEKEKQTHKLLTQQDEDEWKDLQGTPEKSEEVQWDEIEAREASIHEPEIKKLMPGFDPIEAEQKRIKALPDEDIPFLPMTDTGKPEVRTLKQGQGLDDIMDFEIVDDEEDAENV